jgi:hypothetical protein
MADISHWYGSDLTLTSTGDIALASGLTLGQQKVSRDIITNPGDLIHHLDVGAGAAKMVGMPFNLDTVTALILAQMKQESYVSQIYPVTVEGTDYNNGTVSVIVSYVDAQSGSSSVLTLPNIPVALG